MDPERGQLIIQIVKQALSRPPAEQSAYLDRACAGDEDLRHEAGSLIAMAINTEDLMGRPLEEMREDLRQLMNGEESELAPGSTLGCYVIESLEGRGGMGVVYRARDEKLRRQVAIKILAPGTLQDSEARHRFLAEARALARIDHPNILTVYDVDRSEKVDFIAMEWVDGKRLDQLIADRSVSLDQMLGFAIQIAVALSQAHAKGIIHRDLKPANVMVTTSGLVKVFDFGLAKLIRASGSELSTESSAVSLKGKIVGTVAYMSPEQAQGKAVDTRSDIFSFGSVLYEMISRRRAFGGGSAISTIAAIIKEEPAPLDDSVPASLRAVVERCLRKDPERRFQAIADVKIELEEIHRDRVAAGAPGSSLSLSRRTRKLVPAAMILACAILAALIVWRFYPANSELPPFDVIQITSGASWEGEPQISPDGSRIAFSSNASGNMDIYVADITGRGRRQLTTSRSDDTEPAWFPDGTAIAFTSDRRGKPDIWKAGAEGGGETLLVEDGVEPCISPDGTEILFVQVLADGYRVAVAPLADLARVRTLTGLIVDRGSPAWSRDGRRICYVDQQDLWIVDASGGNRKRLTSDGKHKYTPSWSSDGRQIYYSSFMGGGEAIWRVNSSGGTPRRVTAGMAAETHPALSRAGNLLVYASEASKRSIVLLDRQSGTQRILPGRERAESAISSDGTLLIFTSTLSGSDNNLWSQRLQGGDVLDLPVQLTEGEGLLSHPDLSPDGRWIACHRIKGNKREIMIVRSTGGEASQVTSDPPQSFTPAWSPVGSVLAFATQTDMTSQIVTASVNDGKIAGTPHRAAVAAAAYGPAWSPDGKTLAFIDRINDSTEVWMAPADGSAPARQITNGANAEWVMWDAKTGDLLVSGTWGISKVALCRVSLSTGSPSPFVPEIDFGGARSHGLFRVSADGNWLVYTKEEIDGHIWMLKANSGTF